MTKKQIPDSRGAITVRGHEEFAGEIRSDILYFKRLKTRVEQGKKKIRALALDYIEKASGLVTRVEFYDEKGNLVPVTAQDPAKDGNRNTIKQETWEMIEELSAEIGEATPLTETKESYVLTGPFVTVMDAYLNTHFVSQGQAIPDGADKKKTVKLSDEGIAKLEEVINTGSDKARALAQRILISGLKAPAVATEGDED